MRSTSDDIISPEQQVESSGCDLRLTLGHRVMTEWLLGKVFFLSPGETQKIMQINFDGSNRAVMRGASYRTELECRETLSRSPSQTLGISWSCSPAHLYTSYIWGHIQSHQLRQWTWSLYLYSQKHTHGKNMDEVKDFWSQSWEYLAYFNLTVNKLQGRSSSLLKLTAQLLISHLTSPLPCFGKNFFHIAFSFSSCRMGL